jgi:hypothetical protein
MRILTVSLDIADVKGSEGAEDIAHDHVNVASPVATIGRDPAIELRAADEDLPPDSIAGQRMLEVLEEVAELSDAETAVAGEGSQAQEGIKRDRECDPLGQHPANLCDLAATSGPVVFAVSAHRVPDLLRPATGARPRGP